MVPLRSKKVRKSGQNADFFERVVGAVLGDCAQSLARKLHADVTTTATVELRYPNILLLKVGVNGTVNNLSNVTTDTALLLGETGAMNAAALVRHCQCDIADSGHKILVRLKFSGALFYTIFRLRQAKPLFFHKKLFIQQGLLHLKIRKQPANRRVPAAVFLL